MTMNSFINGDLEDRTVYLLRRLVALEGVVADLQAKIASTEDDVLDEHNAIFEEIADASQESV